MKIFTTGGAGFIGGNFVLKQVLYENNKILNFDKLTYAGNLDTVKDVAEHVSYNFIQGDICHRNTVKGAINQFQPDVIVNFAAESHVDRSIDSPFEFIQTNIMGTAVLLYESFLYYKSSDKCKRTYPSKLPNHELRRCSVKRGITNELIELIHS